MQERQTVAERIPASSLQVQLVNQIKNPREERSSVGESAFSSLLEKFEMSASPTSKTGAAGASTGTLAKLEGESQEKAPVSLAAYNPASTSHTAPIEKIEEDKKPEPLLGDINGDGIVDSDDLGLLLGLFGSDSPEADLNGDGIVDISDLNILLANFGASSEEEPTTPVPGDVNGDGIVDATDLAMLLRLFGTDAPEADFNGDGIVDSSDLGILLGAWTQPASEEEQPKPVLGDINGDGVVDEADLEYLLKLFGSNSPRADLNGDGIVDSNDLGILLANWTVPDSNQPVEENQEELTAPVSEDLSKVGAVGAHDLKILSEMFGEYSNKSNIHAGRKVDSLNISELLSDKENA